MREYSRNQRLGVQLMRVLNELLLHESKDPSLKSVSVTSVDLSRDLSVARVYFSMLDPDADPEPVLSGLGRAAGFLRGRVGHALKIRHAPELRFQHDDRIARGVALTNLIDSAGKVGDEES